LDKGNVSSSCFFGSDIAKRIRGTDKKSPAAKAA
jgi:hypothetical protein